MPLAIDAARCDDDPVNEQPHTCPYCDLRFEYHEEVKDHVLRDHGDHAGVAASVEVHELPHA